jgi:capsular polysaccharide biosynthesis protein
MDAQPNEDVRIIIPPDLPGWAHESLEEVGVADRCVPMEEPVLVDRLLVPSFGDPTRLECEWLREQVTESKETHRRVFIARTDATRRRVGNMDELQRVFDRWDIEVVVLSELSVREQIELFSEAELVIGVHGAGLANLVYTYDAHVIELFGTRRLNTYARLCEIVGVAYEHLTCAQHGGRVQVDTTRLKQRLDAWAAR